MAIKQRLLYFILTMKCTRAFRNWPSVVTLCDNTLLLWSWWYCRSDTNLLWPPEEASDEAQSPIKKQGCYFEGHSQFYVYKDTQLFPLFLWFLFFPWASDTKRGIYAKPLHCYFMSHDDVHSSFSWYYIICFCSFVFIISQLIFGFCLTFCLQPPSFLL